MRNHKLILALCGSLALLGGCGGSDVIPPPSTVVITISPTTATMAPNGNRDFTATVTGADDKTVRWSVQEANGGQIGTTGHYVAPTAVGTYHVVASASADSSKKAIATVTVQTGSAVSIAINPTSATVQVGQTQQFTATISGASNTAVNWTVSESGGGSVSASGLYTAPATVPSGAVHVVATSVADASKSATATVSVSAAPVVSVSISPTNATLLLNGTQQFTATVSGTSNHAVTWSVTEAQSGTISAAGLYTAPATLPPGQVHVVATSVADASKSATAVVTVGSSTATSLAWTDPSSGTYQLKKDTALSTATHLVLDLVGSGAPSGTAVAFVLNADTSFVNWAKVASSDTDLVQNGAVLNLGSGVKGLRGKANGAALQALVGQKGLASPVALNGVLARVALDLKVNGPKGTVALSVTKAQLVQSDGTIATMAITVGTLTAQ
ncbi:MAG: Ig-like domain-containing protein [Deltaproteobacteria bacterium]|nr:Ig-like domain-containing protein [Deltaproteobacteria bacterium]